MNDCGDPDPFDLARFVEAQAATYTRAIGELRAGRKTSHWMWFIFPQLAGLGFSETSRFYALRSVDEARAYLAHPLLGPRLFRALDGMQQLPANDPGEVLGAVDARKLQSCLTLFLAADPGSPRLQAALCKWFGGTPDPRTLALLG